MKTINWIFCVAFCITLPLHADNLQVPIGQQSAEFSALERPKTGMLQAQVKSHFGSPLKEFPPKGKPAISRWEYDKFTVYFENDHVIYTVLKPIKHDDVEIKMEETVEMNEADLKP